MEKKYNPTLAAAIALASMSGSAIAQENNSSNLSNLLLEEVVVTAQKREQSIQDVPIAVTFLSADVLEAQGIEDAADLRNVIPNCSVGSYRGEAKVTIRGVGQLVQASNPGVAMHVDGVYQPRVTAGDLLQLDMSGVEVLRGPQGTTYGRNANGGAVNYSTTAPAEDFGGFVRVRVADYDETSIQGALDLPFSDAIRARVAFDKTDRDEGFYENVGDGPDGGLADNTSVRLRLDADMSEDISATVIMTHAESFITNSFDSLEPPSARAIQLNPILNTPPTTEGLSNLQFSSDQPSQIDREYQSVAAILDWSVNDTFGFKSITAIQQWEELRNSDVDLTNGNLVRSEVYTESDTLSQEFNLTFSTDNASGVVGLFYFDDEVKGSNFLPFENGGFFGGTTFLGDTASRSAWDPYTSESVAIFTDVNYDLTDDLSLIFGLRYTDEEVSLRQTGGFFAEVEPGVITPLGRPTDCTTEFVEHEPKEYSVTTPRAGLNYTLSDDNSLYATYSEGFKSGGFSYRSGCGVNYDEETVNAYEIGTKNLLADGRVRLNVSAFFYDYEGYQIEALNGLVFEVSNANAAEVYGLEVESITAITDRLSLVANASYQKSEFTDHETADGLGPRVPNPLAGQPGQPPTVLQVVSVDGNPLPGTPDTTANVSFIYDFSHGVSLQVGASYKSEINFREFNDERDEQEAYTLVNANLRWVSNDEKISVRLWGENLTDEEYTQASFISSLTGNRLGSWGTPRQIGADVRFEF
jgi:iron complex outermembrane receptor protein